MKVMTIESFKKMSNWDYLRLISNLFGKAAPHSRAGRAYGAPVKREERETWKRKNRIKVSPGFPVILL
jgi:hypothetical protein